MANFFTDLGAADPLAIEQKFQNLAKGEQDLVTAKQAYQQSAELHPLKKQAAELEINKAMMEQRKAQEEEEMGNKRVEVKTAFAPQMKQSPRAMSTMFDFYEKNGLVEYVPGPNGDIATVKMKHLKYGQELMRNDTEIQKKVTLDRMADVDANLAEIQQAKVDLQGKKGKDTQEQMQLITAQEKKLQAEKSSLLEMSASLSGKGTEFAEKKMQDATTRRGQDMTLQANNARIGVEREKMEIDELNKAEQRIEGIQRIKAGLLKSDDKNAMLNSVFGNGASESIGMGPNATVKDALEALNKEEQAIYGRHKKLGKAPKTGSSLSAFDRLKNAGGIPSANKTK